MKVKFKAIYLFFGLIILFSCAKMNEPVSVGGSLNIERHFEVCGYARDISVTDSYLYIAEDQAGYTIYDLNTNQMVSHNESYIMETDPIMYENVRAISVFEDEDLLFVYDQYASPAGIFGFDIADKTDPIYLFHLSGNTGSVIQLEPDISSGGGVILYWTSDVSFNFSSSDHSWVGSTAFTFQNSIGGFDLDESKIYIAAEQLGFHIVNKTNGDVISTTNTNGEALNIKIVDHYMVVALRQAGFAVYDISSASNPNLVRQIETNEYIYTIDIEDDKMVLGSHSGGVYLYEISDIENPVLVGNLDSDKIGYTYKAILHNNKIYASTRQGVYKIGID